MSDLAAGTAAVVVAVCGDDDLAQRLIALGVTAGASVEVLRRAPFGDPVLCKLHGFRLALRVAEAGRVTVRPFAGWDA